ncbi:MAG: TIM-barrel domain-containing protein, partial [Eubacteriales bacterium]
KNIVIWGKYRVTVLQDRLFRLERSECGCFRDSATLSVWFRNMPEQSFTVSEKNDRLIIDTGKAKLIIKEERAECRVIINGKTRKIENVGNLKGTYRTLDCCDGDEKYWWNDLSKWRGIISLEDGVCSKTGVAVFDDANTLTLGEDGMPIPERGDGSDEYIFAYGNDFRGAVKALYTITGNVPLLPRFSLGNWWSRYYAYSDKEYMRLINLFEKNKVPLTVATIDMDWHYSNADEIKSTFNITEEEFEERDKYIGESLGWTGYTWNKRLFPDHKKLLSDIEKKNLKITLNIHPADGVRRFELAYPEMASAMGIDPETRERVKFDIADDRFINAYFKLLHKPHEDDGVSFWWIDWQQGDKSSMEGLDPLWSLNHYHFLDNGKNKKFPLILSRYSGIGSHRYPIGFSGDTFITWKTLKYLPYFTSTASNIGYTWWSHDIGGHLRGYTDYELYVRHIQYGVFSPINRLHCSNMLITKEPWFYGNGAGKIAEDFLRLRHRMIPYLYTANYRTHKDGIALTEPLYYEYNVPAAYKYKEEYLFGSELIVAPVTEKAARDRYARIKVYIPEGHFTDIFTGDEYEGGNGGRELTLYRDIESIPVLARAGAVIPLSADEGNSSENPENLEILAYNGNREYTLYEDGGDNNVSSHLTVFRMEYTENGDRAFQTLVITDSGSADVIPENRKITVRFKNIPEADMTLFVNGKKAELEDISSDCAALRFDYQSGNEYKITAVFKRRNKTEYLVARAKDVILRDEGNNFVKNSAWKNIEKAGTVEEYISLVDESELSKICKLRLKETL